MNDRSLSPPSALRLPAALLLAGQLLHIGVTLFHAGGDANDHHAIFATYALSGTWTLVHFGQFLAMAVLLAGLFGLCRALDGEAGPAGWAARLGAAAAVAALALYGVLQAVDGVALKQAVDAWAGASGADRAARFASAEAVRWLEWGMRSYHDVALGLALALLATALARTAGVPRPIAWLAGLSGVAYLAQGWLAGSEGFSPAQSTAIVAAWAIGLAWMVWLAAVAFRAASRRPAGIGPVTVVTSHR